MRPIIVGLWLLAAVPARAETRIAVVHSGELLTSESKGLAEIEKRSRNSSATRFAIRWVLPAFGLAAVVVLKVGLFK